MHLSLSDGIGRIVSMQLLAADEAQARTMEHYFKAHARMSIRRSCVCSQKARKTKHEHLYPRGYKSLLGVYDTQKAIGLLKRLFEDQLAAKLNLFRVSAPLFLEEASGLNDNLNGYERPVLFDIPQAGKEAQVVQSLAKWKRMALYRYDFYPGKASIPT